MPKTLFSMLLSDLLKEAVPDITADRLYDMAGAVRERAEDLDQHIDPHDYDSEEEARAAVQVLYDAADFLGRLAGLINGTEVPHSIARAREGGEASG